MAQAGLEQLPLENAFNQTTFCQSRNDGNHVIPRVCNQFAQCSGDVTFIQNCPSSLFYDVSENQCDYANQIRCLEYQGDVCYGAKDSSFGTFTLSRSGKLYQLTLEHQSGFVSCDASNPNANSNWGCGVGFESVKMGTVVTRSDNSLVYPFFALDTNGYYFLARTDTFSRTLTLYNFNGEVSVSTTEVFRIWHGEDLINNNNDEANNGGTHCVRVWAVITN